MRVVVGLSACLALAHPAWAQPAASDSLRLTRREAIAQALLRNPQIDVAREQSAQARARRVEAIAIPDPALVGAIAQNSATLNPGLAASRAVGVSLDVPFPTKFALRNRAATADVRASESNIRLQQQTIASSTSATYDSLLVARRLRAILQEARQLSANFLTRTQARYTATRDGGPVNEQPEPRAGSWESAYPPCCRERRRTNIRPPVDLRLWRWLR